MESSRQLLGAISIFGGLNAESLDFLAERLEPVTMARGDYFFREGDLAESVYVLESGRAEVVKSRGGQTYSFVTFEPGACFGETALIGIAPQVADIRAETDCRAFRLGRDVLLELYERDLPQFTLVQMNLGREIARRFAMLGEVLFEHAMTDDAGDLSPLARAIHATIK